MQKPILKLNEPRAKLINFTSDLFESGIIWDRFPHGVYISALKPHSNCFPEAVETFFGTLTKNGLKFRFNTPDPRMELFLIRKGFTRYIDAPGTPFYTNTTIPRTCVATPRTEEEIVHLTQKAGLADSESAG